LLPPKEKGRFVLRFFWAGIVVVAFVFGTAGVATADPVSVADVTRTVDTPDGYHLSASLTNVTIQSVPNMAATAFTREAYVSATATATISGGTEPVTGGKLELWFMAGCQIGMEGGGFLGLGSTFGITTVLNNLAGLASPKAELNPTSSLHETPWFRWRLGLLDFDQGLVGPFRSVEDGFELCGR
jgi:MspA